MKTPLSLEISVRLKNADGEVVHEVDAYRWYRLSVQDWMMAKQGFDALLDNLGAQKLAEQGKGKS